jgi:hypothetical protein
MTKVYGLLACSAASHLNDHENPVNSYRVLAFGHQMLMKWLDKLFETT